MADVNRSSATTDSTERVTDDDRVALVTAVTPNGPDVPNRIPEEVLQAAAVPAPLVDVPAQGTTSRSVVSRPSRRSRVPRALRSTLEVNPPQRQGSLAIDRPHQTVPVDHPSAAAQLSSAAAAETAQLITAAAAHLDSVIEHEVANAHLTYTAHLHETPSLTGLLRERVVDRLRQFQQGAGRVDPKKFVIAGTLVAVAAGAFIQHRTHPEDRPSIGNDRGAETISGFDTLHAIVRAPGLYARSTSAHSADIQYVRGAEAAEAALLHTWFLAVTDPEARVAILDATVDHAIATHNIGEMIETVRDRLPMIPGQDADNRADHIRLKAWRTLAAHANAAGDYTQAAHWRARAQQLSLAMLQHGRRVHGHPWSKEVQDALRIGVTTVGGEVPSPRHNPEYLRGYRAALQQVRNADTLAGDFFWHIPHANPAETVRPTLPKSRPGPGFARRRS